MLLSTLVNTVATPWNLYCHYCVRWAGLLSCDVCCMSGCFQADETKVGVLLPEKDRLFRKLLVKFVPLRLVRGQEDLREVDLRLRENQHDNDTVAIGMAARACLADENFEPAKEAKFIRYNILVCPVEIVVLVPVLI